MDLRRLGNSGLYVSEFALGAMTFGMPEWGCDELEASRLISRYLDAGGNFIDTADGYPSSEEICGRAVKARRDKVVIATKFGMPIGGGPHDRGSSRIHIRKACEGSLRRLDTDYIDLYQLHVDDEATPLEETVAALDDLVREGKVLYVGLSNMRAYRVMKAVSIAQRLGACRFVSFQGQYNLIVRTLEREHFELFDNEGIGFISWSPLAAGMLTGKSASLADSPPGTRLARREVAFDSLFRNDRGYAIVDSVRKVALGLGCSPAQVALAWQRTKPVSSVIIGARTTQQLENNLAALDITIPPELLDELELVTAVPAEYPGAFIDIFQSWLRGADKNVLFG